MSQVLPVELPDSFYLPRYSRCGFEIRDIMPWKDALAYVTDGIRFGVQFRDGSVEWVLEPEGTGSVSSQYRIAHEKLLAGVRIHAATRDVVHEIWRRNGALLAGLPGGPGRERSRGVALPRRAESRTGDTQE